MPFKGGNAAFVLGTIKFDRAIALGKLILCSAGREEGREEGKGKVKTKGVNKQACGQVGVVLQCFIHSSLLTLNHIWSEIISV